MKQGYIKVNLNYAPKTNGKKFAKWCEESGFTPLNGGRRAWSGNLRTYLRGASGVAYADGEPFLFYEEDLVDPTAEIIDELERVLEKIEATNQRLSTAHRQIIKDTIRQLKAKETQL